MVAVSDGFTERNNWAGGIRRAQAVDAFDHPDGREDLGLGDGGSLILVTRRVDRPRPHVMFVVASESTDGQQAITNGYRLYGSDGELAALRANPRAALEELIRRFGREFTINDGPPTSFVENMHVDGTEFDLNLDEGTIEVTSFVRRVPDGFDIACIWAIDESRYRGALASN